MKKKLLSSILLVIIASVDSTEKGFFSGRNRDGSCQWFIGRRDVTYYHLRVYSWLSPTKKIGQAGEGNGHWNVFLKLKRSDFFIYSIISRSEIGTYTKMVHGSKDLFFPLFDEDHGLNMKCSLEIKYLSIIESGIRPLKSVLTSWSNGSLAGLCPATGGCMKRINSGCRRSDGSRSSDRVRQQNI